jgi:Na+/H+ antiporter NhaD/arsenite permease-like protein
MAHAIELPIWTVLPFVMLLLAIAVLPLVATHFWESNRNKGVVAALLGAPVAVYLVAAPGEAGVHELIEKAKEYASFIVLLASLFIVTGGIYVRGSLAGTPLVNTGVLGFGALIASWIGTTGASMLLIRPLLRANASREHKAHIVVFFIFVVSNCGGLLTPLGDPPLFLGFLKGVPFTWTFQLWPEWLLVNGALLAVFNVWDQRVLAREERERSGAQLEEVQRHEPLGVEGSANFGFLAAIVAIIFGAGSGAGNGGAPWPFGVQEGLMLAVTALAFVTTPAHIRRANSFGFGPIIEVAVLFAGIFVTMAPALLLLNANARQFGITEPWHFFWVTGVLSSFLDNAPTYLTFAATACGLESVALEGRYLAEYLTLGPRAVEVLVAISTGAVFMGANTYIGNGPNFMVKAIAEENGVRMPSFFGYMTYSGAVLIPLFAAVTFVVFV